jgi:hypothetical protein
MLRIHRRPGSTADDDARYGADFADFARATGARYAIPFASNHCFPHREMFDLNGTVTTPVQVEDYFRAEGIEPPELKVMVSGDSWDSERGFSIAAATPRKLSAGRFRRYLPLGPPLRHMGGPIFAIIAVFIAPTQLSGPARVGKNRISG